MLGLNILLGHVVADHAFTNNAKIRTYSTNKLIGHIIWSVLAILAFTFDTLLKSFTGIVILVGFSSFHAVLDVLRVKWYQKNKKIVDLIELIGIVVALTINLIFASLLQNSYLSPEFVQYLMGMSVVSVGITYIFRNYYPGDEFLPDVDGISERLAIFVFTLASKPLLTLISIAVGLLYRLLFVKRVNHTWWISPVSGILLSLLWKWIIYS
ncbi:MAG: hypothetical protein ACK40Q_05850, partial [Pseudothermotoga sp.]